MKGFGEQKSEEYQIFRQWMGWKWETVRFSKFSSKILADFSNQLENHEPKGHAFSLVLRALKAMPCNEFRLNHRFFCGLWLHMAVFYRKFRTIWGVQVSFGGFWQIFDPQNPLIDFVCFHRAFVWGLSVTASLRCLSHKTKCQTCPNLLEKCLILLNYILLLCVIIGYRWKSKGFSDLILRHTAYLMFLL